MQSLEGCGPCGVEDALERLGEVFASEGFWQVMDDAERGGIGRVELGAAAGGDDGGEADAGGAEAADEVEPVELGHREIGQQHIEIARGPRDGLQRQERVVEDSGLVFQLFDGRR